MATNQAVHAPLQSAAMATFPLTAPVAAADNPFSSASAEESSMLASSHGKCGGANKPE